MTQDGTDNWYVDVTIDLSKRDASGKINSAPYSTIDCYVQISSGCSGLQTLQVPVFDPDGDTVRCYCTNNLCLSVMTIDPITCIITFNPTNGYYAVALTIQDFEAGSSVPKSSVPIQFITYVNSGTGNCRKYYSFYF